MFITRHKVAAKRKVKAMSVLEALDYVETPGRVARIELKTGTFEFKPAGEMKVAYYAGEPGAMVDGRWQDGRLNRVRLTLNW